MSAFKGRMMTVEDLQGILAGFPPHWLVFIDASSEGVQPIRNVDGAGAVAHPNVCLSAKSDKYGRDWTGQTGWDDEDE